MEESFLPSGRRKSEPTSRCNFLAQRNRRDTDCSTLRSPISKNGQDFDSFDFKMAPGLWEILKGDMERKLIIEDRKQRQNDPLHMLSGRQIAFRIFEHFTLPEAEKGWLDLTHLVNLEMKNDNLRAFVSKWDEILLKIQPEPPDVILEALYKNAAGVQSAALYDFSSL